MKKSNEILSVIASLFLIAGATPALAEDTPAAPAADDAPPAPTAMATPAMAGPLAANANPASFDAGPIGKVYVTGALTGLAYAQTSAMLGDRDSRVDLANGQVVIQTTDGPVQFYVQAGGYSIPSLGASYISMANSEKHLFGLVPVAYVKLAPTDSFSIQAGKLPTLIGSESIFTFQNMNIERGLLFNQENVVGDGVQANYTMGPVAFSAAVTTGYYSNKMNWVTGSATYTIDTENTLAFQAGGSLSTNAQSTLATPTAQNNSQLFDLAYTYNAAPWTVTPYLQYTVVPRNESLGFLQEASTVSGALLVDYSFDALPGFSLPARFEYIASHGSAAEGAPNLLYGPGSKAVSFTLTPTYQKDLFFVRAEASVVKASSFTDGSAFGQTGVEASQFRFALETGLLF